MQIFKTTHNGNEYEFVCKWGNTRSGFKHECRLFINNQFKTDATCYYYNRTWESYNYQSVMLRAVGTLMEGREEFLKDAFKDERGYKQMTAKRKEEFEKVLVADSLMLEYKEVKEKLHKGFRD